MKFIQKNSPPAAFSTNLSVRSSSCSSALEEKEIGKFTGGESVRAHLDHLLKLLKSSNSVDCEMVKFVEKLVAEAIQNLVVCDLRASPRTQAVALLVFCSQFVENKEAANVIHCSFGNYSIGIAFNELLPHLKSLFPQYSISEDLLKKIRDSRCKSHRK